MTMPALHHFIPSRSEMRNWRKALNEGRENLFLALEKDTGKRPVDSFLSEWLAVEGALSFLEQETESLMSAQPVKSAMHPLLGHRQIWSRRIPHGKVLVVGTWNYPLALHLQQILFAVAAGNKVFFKGSPRTQNFSLALGGLLAEILGADRFENLDPGSTDEPLQRIKSGHFQLVLFTGGSKAAKLYAQACAEALIPLIAEASGSELALFLDNSFSQEDLDHLLWAAFHYSGQTCVAPRFVLVPKRELDEFWNLLTKIFHSQNALSLTDPFQDELRDEHENWCRWIEPQSSRSESQGIFRLFKVDDFSVLDNESPANFGPALAVVGYTELGQALDWLRASPWSLMTTVFGRPNRATQKLLETKLDASIVSFNEATVSAGDAAIPFGGRACSGYGVCHGKEGLMQLSRSQSWVEVNPWPGLSKLGMRPSWSKIDMARSHALWMKESAINQLRKTFGRILR